MIKIILFEIPSDFAVAFAFVGVAWAIAFACRNGFEIEFADPKEDKDDENN